MTQIDFYTHVDDRLRVACTLLAKAHAQGMRAFARCPDAATAHELDRRLWTTPATGFTPHCGAQDRRAAVTPVIIDHGGATPAHDELLLNLGGDVPPYFSRFRRLIEIVGLDDEERELARTRYRHYRDRGYELRTHDLGKGR